MTIHFNYDYECSTCTKLFLPFEDVCPNCGAPAPKDDSIIEAFVKSAKYNKENEGVYSPTCWGISSLTDSVQYAVFWFLDNCTDTNEIDEVEMETDAEYLSAPIKRLAKLVRERIDQ